MVSFLVLVTATETERSASGVVDICKLVVSTSGEDRVSAPATTYKSR